MKRLPTIVASARPTPGDPMLGAGATPRNRRTGTTVNTTADDEIND
jgi:hypothetical protein